MNIPRTADQVDYAEPVAIRQSIYPGHDRGTRLSTPGATPIPSNTRDDPVEPQYRDQIIP